MTWAGDMMKKRDVVLDFTSLLDVTLILLFFFVMFSTLDSQQNEAKVNEKAQELQTAIQDAEDREEEASQLASQLEEDIEIVRNANKRTADNTSAIISYNRGENLKLILGIDDGGNAWNVRVVRGEDLILKISSGNDISKNIMEALQSAKYEKESSILCEFIYNGQTPGTRSAYMAIKSSLETVRSEYKYLYISETDLSIGGE
jgi:biopolymer transport protein ExbD